MTPDEIQKARIAISKEATFKSAEGRRKNGANVPMLDFPHPSKMSFDMGCKCSGCANIALLLLKDKKQKRSKKKKDVNKLHGWDKKLFEYEEKKRIRDLNNKGN